MGEQLIEDDTAILDLYIDAAREHCARSDWQAAILVLEAALLITPSDATGYSNLAGVLLRAGETARALSTAEAGLRLDPDHLDLKLHRAVALSAGGHYEEALQLFADVLCRNPLSLGGLLGLGYVFVKLGQIDEASSCFHRTAELYPYKVESLGGMAYLLAAQGRLDEARSYYRAATRARAGERL